VTHVAEEEIAMTREPAADDSSSWSAASAGHGAGEREELEAATHARCLSKWRGEEKKPRTEWAHRGVFIGVFFIFIFFKNIFTEVYF